MGYELRVLKTVNVVSSFIQELYRTIGFNNANYMQFISIISEDLRPTFGEPVLEVCIS